VLGRLGTKKKDHGVLPLDHPEIMKLSDPIHFVKNYKSELYILVNAPKATSETHKVDAMRLSWNLACMCAQMTPDTDGCTFEKFQIMGWASFEHHWNNHEFCGLWCQAKLWNAEEKIKFKNKYRDKETNRKEYEQQLQVITKFTKPLRMKRAYHIWNNNNKTEQIHGVVVNRFLLKRSYYCQTICGKARMLLAVSIDTLGYSEYYKILYNKLGLTMSSITGTYFLQHDKKRRADQIYAKKPAQRRIRAQQRLDNVNKEWNKEVLDKQDGNTYHSQMTAPQVP
jgi:hypothetical protein